MFNLNTKFSVKNHFPVNRTSVPIKYSIRSMITTIFLPKSSVGRLKIYEKQHPFQITIDHQDYSCNRPNACNICNLVEKERKNNLEKQD